MPYIITEIFLSPHQYSHNIWSMNATLERRLRCDANFFPNDVKHTKISSTTIFMKEIKKYLQWRLNISFVTSFRHDCLTTKYIDIPVVGNHLDSNKIFIWWLIVMHMCTIVKAWLIILCNLRLSKSTWEKPRVLANLIKLQ